MDRRGIAGLGLRTYARPVLSALMSASFAGLVACPLQYDEPQEHCGSPGEIRQARAGRPGVRLKSPYRCRLAPTCPRDARTPDTTTRAAV